MTARELMRRYGMRPHVENGAFIERHYPNDASGRAASGVIYYYVDAGERTEFHRIDCDEYWCYSAGEPLEIWQVDANGALTVQKLGVEADCQPVVYFKKGVIFASRSSSENGDGTFLSCVTVPRFSADGFELFEREAVLKDHPELKAFYA